ncbi:MAG: DUF3102 domain-containing protein [Hydrogenophilales bacterium CG17_big_fil_post_rev_8_21_14_2_50_63_12]|nr:MAG: DUF3102 domain-containing protein [Hydrogenophilales bacterium CG17_big_fil_post_rev_8_21_14_2_50_63_12]PIX97023.1 MAG: DUF3102 domain-containing protein [Hydrogenophilales bacterium CG_4_10_14_3_um_filter_63_21]PJB02327.1 MAG: DUF3102 domain-containing protein [Hydrogenophilales bacterium CG_4_9_14_3_um_filter_63_34]
MPRKPTAPVKPDESIVDQAQLAEDFRQAANLAPALIEIDKRFSDGLPYDQQRIINECRFYMAQSAEAMLEAGKRLILLKEHEAHGEFTYIVTEQLGLNERVARRMMQAAFKYNSPQLEAKRTTLAVLGKAKLFELMAEDDEELAALAEGGSVAGLTLDDIDRMSTRELRHALRKERQDAGDSREDLEKVIAQKDKKLNDYALELERLQRMPPEAKEAERQRIENETLSQLQDASLKLMFEVQTFSQSVANCLAGTEQESAMQEAVCSTVRWLFQRIDEVAKGNGIPVDFAEMVTPSWMRDAMQRHGIEAEEV